MWGWGGLLGSTLPEGTSLPDQTSPTGKTEPSKKGQRAAQRKERSLRGLVQRQQEQKK